MVRFLPERVRCPRCGSIFIAVTSPDDDEAERVLSVAMRGGTLDKESRRVLHRLQQSASLVASYGKRAVVAMAARGVGPATALRILRGCSDEAEFYLRILEAERQYLRTRRYWD